MNDISLCAVSPGMFSLLEQLPCSSERAPSDYDKKRELSGGSFDSDDDVISAVDDFLEVQDNDFYENMSLHCMA